MSSMDALECLAGRDENIAHRHGPNLRVAAHRALCSAGLR